MGGGSISLTPGGGVGGVDPLGGGSMWGGRNSVVSEEVVELCGQGIVVREEVVVSGRGPPGWVVVSGRWWWCQGGGGGCVREVVVSGRGPPGWWCQGGGGGGVREGSPGMVVSGRSCCQGGVHRGVVVVREEVVELCGMHTHHVLVLYTGRMCFFKQTST